MEEYVDILSQKHQRKLMIIARKSGVNIRIAIRNIVNHLKSKKADGGQFLTAKQIEAFIDNLNL